MSDPNSTSPDILSDGPVKDILRPDKKHIPALPEPNVYFLVRFYIHSENILRFYLSFIDWWTHNIGGGDMLPTYDHFCSLKACSSNFLP
jgi:hypothetical protein